MVSTVARSTASGSNSGQSVLKHALASFIRKLAGIVYSMTARCESIQARWCSAATNSDRRSAAWRWGSSSPESIPWRLLPKPSIDPPHGCLRIFRLAGDESNCTEHHSVPRDPTRHRHRQAPGSTLLTCGQAPIRAEHHALLPGPERSRGNLRPHRAVSFTSVHKLKGSDRPAVDEYLCSVGRHPSTEGGRMKGIAADGRLNL